MSHKVTIDAVAAQHGWVLYAGPGVDPWVTEYRRHNGRKVAYVRVVFGVLNQVVEASWADNLQGTGGRGIGARNSGKRDWVLDKLTSTAARPSR